MYPVAFRWLFFAVCAVAVWVPLINGHNHGQSTPGSRRGLPSWPEHFEHRPLRSLPLTELEEEFNVGFPGKIARFSDGQRELILRWVTLATRKVHPAADCFRGLGYAIQPLPPFLDLHGARWSRFTATRGRYRLLVRERITDAQDVHSWSDVSAWFWSALLRQTRGPWLAITVVEGAPD